VLSRVGFTVVAGCALLIGACGGDPPVPVPVDGASPLPPASTATALPTATAAATPTAEPGQTPAPSPTPSSNLGIGWLPVSSAVEFTSSDVIADAAAAGQALVAVGTYDDGTLAGATAWYSLDGTAWQRAPVEGGAFAAMEDVTVGSGGFVAVGYDYAADEVVPAVWLSLDGVEWLRVSDDDLGRGQMTAVAAGARGYVALGFDPAGGEGLAWTSADGRAWNAAVGVPVFGLQPSVNDVIARVDGYLAYGSTGADERAALWRSRDGIEWLLVDAFPSTPGSSVMAVAASGASLAAVGADYSTDAARALAWVSTDGQLWQRTLDPAATETGEMLAVVPVGIGFMAVGAAGGEGHGGFAAAVWSSTDGFAWRREPDDASFANARMSEVVRAGPGLVALGEAALDPAGENVRPQVWLGVAR
jgi:hypothetical protein